MSTVQYPERLKELAKSYYFKNTKKKSKNLVILVHGFGASATETRPLGEFLFSEGYDVKGILLKGHGTKPDDMDNVSWEEWIGNIREVYDEYCSKYPNIFVGGVSMGGALALYSSTQMKFKAIFTINAFYHLSKTMSFATWFLSLFDSHKQKNEAIARIGFYLRKCTVDLNNFEQINTLYNGIENVLFEQGIDFYNSIKLKYMEILNKWKKIIVEFNYSNQPYNFEKSKFKEIND